MERKDLPKCKFKNDKQRKAVMASINQSKRGMHLDRKITAKNTRPLTRDNVNRWKKHPNRSDIHGIDTKITEKKSEGRYKKGDSVYATLKKDNGTAHYYTDGYVESYNNGIYRIRGKNGNYFLARENDITKNPKSSNEDQLIKKDIEKYRGKEIRPRKGAKPSIEWQGIGRGKLKSNAEHTVAKGSVEDFESTEGYYNQCTKKSQIRIKIKDEDIYDLSGSDEQNNVRVGGNIYSKGLLYDIAEDASGEKILTKTGNVRKSAVGKVVVLNVRTNPNLDRFDPTYPMIVEGKDSMYAIAPKVESE